MPANTTLHEDKRFDFIDYSGQKLTGNEFFNCTFRGCNFSGSNLSGVDFIDCRFESCNCSLLSLEGTGLKGVSFKETKLTGIDFGRCSDFLFAVSFEDCPMDLCSFFRRKLKKTVFRNCSLKEADFEEADLSGAAFRNCDLLFASFVRTVLERADFRTAYNYALDPEINRLKKAKFSRDGIAGLLAKYDIDIE